MAEPDLSRITPLLRPLARPIDTFGPWPGNPRRGAVEVIADSLTEFGQLSPVVVQRSSGHIAAGNHVWRAARMLGWTHLAFAEADLSDAEARAYVVADNRLSDLAVYDPGMLRALLTELDAAQALAGTGFTRDELNAMMLDAPSGEESPGARRGAAREPAEGATEAWDGPMPRTVVLPYSEADRAAVLAACGRLRAAYGTTSTASTILRALERQAALR